MTFVLVDAMRWMRTNADNVSAVYSIAQAQKAVNPKDEDGPFGQRIASTVSGDLSWALIATAYVTNRNSASAWPRYSLVVLNWSVQTLSKNVRPLVPSNAIFFITGTTVLRPHGTHSPLPRPSSSAETT